MSGIIKLHPLFPGHWGLFERFVARCVDFGERSGWPVSAEWRQEIWRRWIEAPLLSGYFITEEADAHLFAWMVGDFGVPGIHIYQCEGRSMEVFPLLDEFFYECMPAWQADIEKTIRQPIQFFEFDTTEPVLWERILERHGFGKVKKRAILRVSLNDERT